MASEFAKRITEAVQQKSWMTDTADAIDGCVELSEAREVLAQCIRRIENLDGESDKELLGEDPALESARIMYEKLKVED